MLRGRRTSWKRSTTRCCSGHSGEPPTGRWCGSPPGFSVEVHIDGGPAASVAATYSGRKKRITIDGEEVSRLADSVGHWLAVAFLPADVGLASGPAVERRQYLDRVLSLSDRRYLRALTGYRAALAQRNSALRQGRVEVAQAFNGALATAGSALVRWRLDWVDSAAEQFAAELECLGEQGEACLRYRGRLELADAAGWEPVLAESLPDDRARGMTTVGPHRDDLVLEVNGRRLRDYGSTGQQRSAAIALKLIEITSLRRARDTEPALLLDDVFAELDGERQQPAGGPAAGVRRPAGLHHQPAAGRAAGQSGSAGVGGRGR